MLEVLYPPGWTAGRGVPSSQRYTSLRLPMRITRSATCCPGCRTQCGNHLSDSATSPPTGRSAPCRDAADFPGRQRVHAKTSYAFGLRPSELGQLLFCGLGELNLAGGGGGLHTAGTGMPGDADEMRDAGFMRVGPGRLHGQAATGAAQATDAGEQHAV